MLKSPKPPLTAVAELIPGRLQYRGVHKRTKVKKQNLRKRRRDKLTVRPSDVSSVSLSVAVVVVVAV